MKSGESGQNRLEVRQVEDLRSFLQDSDGGENFNEWQEVPQKGISEIQNVMMQAGSDYQQCSPSDFGGMQSTQQSIRCAQAYDEQELSPGNTGRATEQSILDTVEYSCNDDDNFQNKHSVRIYSEQECANMMLEQDADEIRCRALEQKVGMQDQPLEFEEVKISHHIDAEAEMQMEQDQIEAKERHELMEKIQFQNRLNDENEAALQQADQNDKDFVEFQLNVLLSLRRKNLAIMGEQVQKEQTFLDKIELAEQTVQDNKVKLEEKLKAERESLHNQMQELQQQLEMVKQNRADRIECTNEKLSEIQERKMKIKSEIESQVEEHHACLKQVITDLAWVKPHGDSQDNDYNALITDFMAVSGSIGPELLQEMDRYDQQAANDALDNENLEEVKEDPDKM